MLSQRLGGEMISMRVNRLSALLVLSAAAAAPAHASDISPEPLASWAGLYAGVHAGYGWASSLDATFDAAAFAASAAPTLVVTDATAPFALSTDAEGAVGGIQLGYNWQRGTIVFGLEVDASLSDIDDEDRKPFSVTGTVGGDNGDFTGEAYLKQDLDHLGTLRARLGVASGNLLLYATGGLAWGHVETSFGVDNIVLAAPGNYGGPNPAPAPASLSSASDTHAGYALGGGLEWGFAPQWSFKTEYLYVDLGSETYFEGTASETAIDLDVHTVRIGLNYRFGSEPGPAPLK